MEKEPFLANCHKAMGKVADAALRNVSQTAEGLALFDSSGNYIKGRLPRGGPFGAALAVFDSCGEMEMLGGPCVNAVVESGIASRHAEHETLSPETLRRLTDRLRKAKEAQENLTVVLFSSAQPCPTCQTKIEITARFLIDEDLLCPSNFLVVYGLGYVETEKLASFDDRTYALALYLAADKPDAPNNLIRRKICAESEAPEAVRAFFATPSPPNRAVVLRQGNLYAIGEDERTAFDLFATAESCAIRNACLNYRKEGHFDSWTVDGTLYTPNLEMGPLLFAEAAWTGINTIVHVSLKDFQPDLQTRLRETKNASNAEFLSVLASGYGHPDRAVQTFRDPSCPDDAHKVWGYLVNRGLLAPYNGASGLRPLPDEKETVALRFTAPDIRVFT